MTVGLSLPIATPPTMSLKSWLADLFKGLALSLEFEFLVIEFVYLLLAVQPQHGGSG